MKKTCENHPVFFSTLLFGYSLVCHVTSLIIHRTSAVQPDCCGSQGEYCAAELRCWAVGVWIAHLGA